MGERFHVELSADGRHARVYHGPSILAGGEIEHVFDVLQGAVQALVIATLQRSARAERESARDPVAARAPLVPGDPLLRAAPLGGEHFRQCECSSCLGAEPVASDAHTRVPDGEESL